MTVYYNSKKRLFPEGDPARKTPKGQPRRKALEEKSAISSQTLPVIGPSRVFPHTKGGKSKASWKKHRWEEDVNFEPPWQWYLPEHH